MLAVSALLVVVAALLVLRVCAAQIEDGESLHALTVRVHTLRNEYVSQLRGEEIIEVEEVAPQEAAVIGQVGQVGDVGEVGEPAAQAA